MVSLLAWRIGKELRISLKVAFYAPAEGTISTLHCHIFHAAVDALTIYVKFAMLFLTRAIMNYAVYCTLELPI